jgi:hypothetical protein
MKRLAPALFIFTALFLGFCAKEPLTTDCQALRESGIIDSFAYPVRPGSDAWRSLTSHDQMVAAVTVPRKELDRMCTRGIVYTCISCPLFIDMFAYNFLSDGYNALCEQVNSFDELRNRADAGLELLSYYSENFDTAGTGYSSAENRFNMYMFESFFAREDFLVGLPDDSLKAVLRISAGNLRYRKRINSDDTFIISVQFLMANCLYWSAGYPEFRGFIERHSMQQFILTPMFFQGQPVDSVEWYAAKYLTGSK